MQVDFWIFSVAIWCTGLVLNHVNGLPVDRKYCGRSLERHEELVPIVVSAHVIRVLENGSDARGALGKRFVRSAKLGFNYSAVVQIKRVFKGNDVISSISPVAKTNGPFGNYNKKVRVLGFRASSDSTCVSDVRKGDTKIFFLDYSRDTGELKLHPPIVPLSVYHLDRVEAAVKGK